MLELCRHTSASLTINENADPTVRTDMEAAFNHIAPESWNDEFFEHTYVAPAPAPTPARRSYLCRILCPNRAPSYPRHTGSREVPRGVPF